MATNSIKIIVSVAGVMLATAAWAVTAPTAQKQLVDDVSSKWQLPQMTTVAAAVAPRDGTDVRRAALRAAAVENIEAVKIPLSAALELLNEQIAKNAAKINFVTVGGLDPEITVTLNKVNAEEALDLMLEGTGLVYEFKGSAIVIRPATTVGSVEVRYYPLSQSLLGRLVGQPAVGADGKVLAFDKAAAEGELKRFLEQMGIVWGENTGLALADGELVVSQSGRAQEKIGELLGRMSKQRQVEIEARFMEVGEGALDELGVQWNAANASGSRVVGTTGVSGTTSNDALRTIADAVLPTASSTGVTAPTMPGGINTAANTTALADLSKQVGDFKVRGILQALSQKDGSELLSAPRVTVLSGATASLTVAQEMRYPQSYDRVNTDVGTGSTSGSIITAPTPLDFTTRNIGVELKATPIVEADGSISLQLEPQVTQFERFIDYGGQSVVVNGTVTQTLPSGFFQPVFSVRKVTTSVNLPNGGTVLMGGLTRQESVKVKDKVPLLGDMPLVGKAFRHEGTSTLKRNLVIFVTARLVE